MRLACPCRPENFEGLGTLCLSAEGAEKSARQQAGSRLVSSLPTDTTKATPRRTTSGTNTSGYLAIAAKPMERARHHQRDRGRGMPIA